MCRDKILVINDEDSTTQLLLMLLGIHGYDVVSVRNGEQALHRDNTDTDLILLDSSLPDTDGFKVCHYFKTDSYTKHIPIIIISAHHSGDRAQSFHLGAEDHLSKPFESEELLVRVEAVLNRHRKLELDEQDLSVYAIVSELHRIIDKKEIIPYFQPIYFLDRQSLYGVEVLCRPQTTGMLTSPEALFKAATRYGMYYELEMVVWQKALAIAHKTFEQEQLFLNCSPSLIENDRFEEVSEMFADQSVSPSQVFFEITERNSINHPEMYYQQLSRYREKGFKIAIDDVGSGYSSLEAIMRTKPEVVKIDRQIINGLSEDPFKRSIVKLIVAFCCENSIICIAEGIETKQDLEILVDMGVHAGQGYYFFRPTSPINLDVMRAIRK